MHLSSSPLTEIPNDILPRTAAIPFGLSGPAELKEWQRFTEAEKQQRPFDPQHPSETDIDRWNIWKMQRREEKYEKSYAIAQAKKAENLRIRTLLKNSPANPNAFDGFCSAIRENPGDLTARLIACDWLEETGKYPPHVPAALRKACEPTFQAAHVSQFQRLNTQLEQRHTLKGETLNGVYLLGEKKAGEAGIRIFCKPRAEAAQLARVSTLVRRYPPIHHLGVRAVTRPEIVIDILKTAKGQLDHLSFECNRGPQLDAAFMHALAGSRAFASLSKLTIRDEITCSIEGISDELAASPYAYNIACLEIIDTDWGQYDLETIAQSSTLKPARLHVQGECVGAAHGLWEIFSRKNGSCITSLSMCGQNEEGHNIIGALTKARYCLNIADLKLESQRIEDNGLAALLDWKGIMFLKSLGLGCNPIGDTGAQILANCPHLSRLKMLDLSHCRIGNDGIRALLSSPSLPDGLILNLRENYISTAPSSLRAAIHTCLEKRGWNIDTTRQRQRQWEWLQR